jgi:hypothetical protein
MVRPDDVVTDVQFNQLGEIATAFGYQFGGVLQSRDLSTPDEDSAP